MKKYVKAFILLSLLGLVAVFSMSAEASWVSKIVGTIFDFVMKMMGFGDSLNEFCWFCPIVETLFNAANNVATSISLTLRNVFLMLLGVGTLFFIAFKVGATVIKLQEVDLMQFMGDLFKTLGRVIIAAAILTQVTFVSQEILTPIIGFALQFSLNIMQDLKVDNKIFNSLKKNMSIPQKANEVMAGAQSLANTYGSETKVLSSFVKQSVIAVMAQASANFVVGMAVGVVLMMISTFSSMILPDFQNTLSGGIIFFAFAVLYITVPFQLINFVVQLAFVVALLPLWVILWVFPATTMYCKNAWNLFIQTSVSFMVFGVMLVLVMNLVGHMLPNSTDILSSMIPGYEWIAGKKASALSNSVLMTLALSYLCKELLKSAGELSSRITSTYGVSVADKLTDQMAKVAGSSISGGIAGGFLLGKGAEHLKDAFTGDFNKAQEIDKYAHQTGAGYGREYLNGGLTGWLFGTNNTDTPANNPNKYGGNGGNNTGQGQR